MDCISENRCATTPLYSQSSRTPSPLPAWHDPSELGCLTTADSGGAAGGLSSPVPELGGAGGSSCSVQPCTADYHRQHVLPRHAGRAAAGGRRARFLWTEHTIHMLSW